MKEIGGGIHLILFIRRKTSLLKERASIISLGKIGKRDVVKDLTDKSKDWKVSIDIPGSAS